MKKLLLLLSMTISIYSYGQTADVTFKVDMNEYTGDFTEVQLNGTFNGWCGSCNPMTDDDSDGVWEVTLALDTGLIEYKFTYDNWTGQESLTEGSACTMTTDGFTNRFLQVSENIVLDVVCWESCAACGIGPSTSNVTFKVDMNEYTGDFTEIQLNGTFNGWCGACNPMTDDDADGIWEVTLPLPNDTIEYKFTYDNWTGQESLTEGSECTMTTDGFTNRFLILSGDTVLPIVCWEECVACVVGIENVDPMNSISLYPNPANEVLFVEGEFNTNSNYSMMISDLQGKIVYSISNQGSIIREKINTSEMSEGMYILNIQTQEGIHSEKISITK